MRILKLVLFFQKSLKCNLGHYFNKGTKLFIVKLKLSFILVVACIDSIKVGPVDTSVL